MPEVPTDLVKLTKVLEQYKPSRTWWDAQFTAGRITAYKVPGERGLWVSQAEVDKLMQPHPYIKGEGEDEDVG